MLNQSLSRNGMALAIIPWLFFILGSSLPAVAKDSGQTNNNPTKRGWLGVMLQDIDSKIAEVLDLENDDGVLIADVIADGPAHEAGLENGDVIIEFDGKKLANYMALTKVVRASSPGDRIEVVVLRDGKKKKLDVKMGERQENTWTFNAKASQPEKMERLREKLRKVYQDQDVFVWHDGDKDNVKVMIQGLEDIEGLNMNRGFMGVELNDLNDQMGEYFEVDDGEGALVTKVIEDTGAEKAGLKAGDVIVQMGDRDIDSAEDVHKVLGETLPGDELEIKVIRKGKTKKMKMTLGEMPDDFDFDQLPFFGMEDNFPLNTPQTFLQDGPDPDFPLLEREIRITDGSDEDLDELKGELEQLKKELEELKDELKK